MEWDAPGEAARDYRVSWAKVGEAFRTWTDLDYNAFPTAASLTISGLEGGSRYKVMVRARYEGGAGPWTGEVESTVMDEESSPPTNRAMTDKHSDCTDKHSDSSDKYSHSSDKYSHPTDEYTATNTAIPPTNTSPSQPTNTTYPANEYIGAADEYGGAGMLVLVRLSLSC